MALAVVLLLVLALPGAEVRGERRDATDWWAGTACGSPTAPPPERSPAAPPGGPLAVGAQFHGLWQEYTDAQRAEVLDALVDAGVRTVRIDVSWAMLQPDGPDRFSEWGVRFVDDVLAMVHDRGLAPLVTLWLTPSWVDGGRGDRSLPDDPVEFGRVAQWAAERWRGQVAAWEVWNEPNDADFAVGASPVEYVRLLKAAYCGFATGAPGTPVVFAGTSYVDVPWMTQAYAAGAGGWFDVMGVHPYMGVGDAPPETPDDGTGRAMAALADLHDLMVAHGDGDKPIWITEMGWSAHANTAGTPNWARGVPEAVQGEYLVRALELLRAEHPYVERFYWYAERNLDTGDPHYDGYGLLTNDLRPKPVYRQLAAFLAR